MIRFPGRILPVLAAVVLAVLPGALAAQGPPPDVPEPVLRARLAHVHIVGGRESGWFSLKGFLVAPGRVVTYSHGPRPRGSPGDEYVIYLVGYGVWVKGIRSEFGHIWIDRQPSVRARYRCLDGYHDYIMWDVLDPLPEDLPLPPTSNDRRGLLYVLVGDLPQKAYAEHGAPGWIHTGYGTTGELPRLRLTGPMEPFPGWSGSMVVNARGEVVGMHVGSAGPGTRLTLISPAEAWNCPFGMVRR